MKDLKKFSTMSSKEIAKLTEKRHGDVLRDIKVMREQLQGDESDLRHEGIQLLRDERKYICEALLNEEMTYTLITGYSVVLRNRIIKRWQELEQQNARPSLVNSQLQSIVDMAINLDRAEQTALHAQAEAARANQRLDQIETSVSHYTIVGWCRLKQGRSVTNAESSAMGKKATAHCKVYGIPIGKARHEVYGEVGTYPIEILEELFGEKGSDEVTG